MSKHPKYIFPLRLLQKILLIGVVQALMSGVGKQMTKETGTSAAIPPTHLHFKDRSVRQKWQNLLYGFLQFARTKYRHFDNDVEGVAGASSGRKI